MKYIGITDTSTGAHSIGFTALRRFFRAICGMW